LNNGNRDSACLARLDISHRSGFSSMRTRNDAAAVAVFDTISSFVFVHCLALCSLGGGLPSGLERDKELLLMLRRDHDVFAARVLDVDAI
jgi:hypothetical protein